MLANRCLGRFTILVGSLCIPLVHAGGGPVDGAVAETWWSEEYEYTFLEVMVTILMLWLALAFEAFWHWFGHGLRSSYQYGKKKANASEQHLHDHDHHGPKHVQLAAELMNRAGGEFMTLGFLAAIIFAANNVGTFKWCVDSFHTNMHMHMPKTDGDWLHLAEFVHFQLFLAMLLYFILMARVVKGSIERIKFWEECSQGHTAEGQLSHPMGWDLAVYRCWREYFITKMVSWQTKRPTVFKELLKRLDMDDQAPDVSPQFKAVLQKEFYFSAYLALCVGSGVTDSIQIHPLTWFMVLVVFGFFAIMNWFVMIPLGSWTPGFIVCVIGCLIAMWGIVLRKRHHVERVIRSDETAQGHIIAQRTASVGSANPDMEEHLRFHQRHNTEIIMLRGLQVVLFLLCYEFARVVLDVHDWKMNPGMHMLYCGLFVLLFLVLAVCVPFTVPMFLGIMALPPYVDHSNFEAFQSVLLKSRAQSEISLLRKLTTNLRSRDISRLGSDAALMQDILSRTFSSEGANRLLSQGSLCTSKASLESLPRPSISAAAAAAGSAGASSVAPTSATAKVTRFASETESAQKGHDHDGCASDDHMVVVVDDVGSDSEEPPAKGPAQSATWERSMRASRWRAEEVGALASDKTEVVVVMA